MPITTPPDVVARYGDPDHFRHVLAHLLIPAVEAAELHAIPPSASGSDLIHAEIVRHLETADLVLCDMSGLNPNVFFELGIRTAVDKPVALVRDEATDRIPFDTGILNTHAYDGALSAWTLEAQVAALAAHVRASLERSDGRNTLWRHFGLTSRASFGAADAEGPEAKLDYILREVDALSRRIYDESSPPSRVGWPSLAATLSKGRPAISEAEALRSFNELDVTSQRLVTHFFGLDGTRMSLHEAAEAAGVPRDEGWTRLKDAVEHMRHLVAVWQSAEVL